MNDNARQFHKPAWIGEFHKFIVRGNVVDLAVGIIIGAAFTAIVSSLVKDVLTPFIGLFTGGIDFTNIFIALKGPHLATLADSQKAGAVTINIGIFLNAVIQFLIVSFVVFWIVKLVSIARAKPKVEEAPAAPPAPPEPSKSEVLLTEIRDLLAHRAG